MVDEVVGEEGGLSCLRISLRGRNDSLRARRGRTVLPAVSEENPTTKIDKITARGASLVEASVQSATDGNLCIALKSRKKGNVHVKLYS